jgi:predicted RNase H-like HicB family nuclease
MVQKAKFSVVLYPQLNGGYTVICPELPGCISQGDTYEEALENIKDVIHALLDMQEDKQDIIDSLAVPNKIFTEVEIEDNA